MEYEVLNSIRIGIVGGGQLAKMMAASAMKFGFSIFILEKVKNTPCENLATEILYGDWDDPSNLLKLANKVDIVTLENEFVDAKSLSFLEKNSYKLFPYSKTIALVQDKLVQKKVLNDAGISVAPFAKIESKNDIILEAKKLGWPIILKKRRNGYDGKGNATIHDKKDIDAAWDKLDGENQELYVESFCNFSSELAVMITRSTNGEIATYPIVESIQKNHICHKVKAPADINKITASKALELSIKAVETIDGVGSFGIEMFYKDNEIILNEMAPRVHNSGHYTIEACQCSQFENHIRAILGLPLGSTKMIAPAAVMVNILGDKNGSGYPNGIEDAFKIDNAHIHIYGKKTSTIGRKMGHVTALGSTINEAEKTANLAASLIHFGE
tara:strand:+ start:180 stop:1334 length:1155 start_codon:yes stop_codon:yes gene_type:complete